MIKDRIRLVMEMMKLVTMDAAGEMKTVFYMMKEREIQLLSYRIITTERVFWIFPLSFFPQR